MSYGIMAYAIDLDEIRAVIGSRSQQALETYEADFAHDAAAIDEFLEDHAEEGEGEPLPTARDALRQLIMGEPMDERVGFAYAYCLKYLCDAHGEFLDNGAWYSVRTAFLEQVQNALDGAGVAPETISVARLTAGGSPIAIPDVEEWPGIGFLARDAIRGALDSLARVNPAEIADGHVRDSVKQLTEWLSICRDQNRDLICFYH
jgi:hypothetical protein